MKITRFEEPVLQFGTSQHVDIRFGIMNYCPLDFDSDHAPKKIRVGIVGSAVSLEGLRDWLEKCRHEILAKQSRKPNLFPSSPVSTCNVPSIPSCSSTLRWNESFRPLNLPPSSQCPSRASKKLKPLGQSLNKSDHCSKKNPRRSSSSPCLRNSSTRSNRPIHHWILTMRPQRRACQAKTALISTIF